MIQPLPPLMAEPERREELRRQAADWPSWLLRDRQICDLELLLNGGFSPLDGFHCRADYEGCCRDMRLADGRLWPIPVVLDVPDILAVALHPGAPLVLRDHSGLPLAVLHVDDIWQPDREMEATQVYGTDSTDHPGVAYLLDRVHPRCVGRM